MPQSVPFGGPGGNVNFIDFSELVVAAHHPTLTDVTNRPLQQILTASGIDPSTVGNGFIGFSTVGHLHHVADIVDFPTLTGGSGLQQTATIQTLLATPNPTLNQQIFVISTGQVMQWNGTKWVPSLDRTYQIFNVFTFGATASTKTITSQDIVNNTGIWQGTYPVGATWDRVAIQEAIYAAYGVPGKNSHGMGNTALNAAIYIPPGNFFLDAALQLTHVGGALIYGAGEFTTTLWGLSTVPNTTTVMNVNGNSYSRFENFAVQQSPASPNPTGNLWNQAWDGTTGGSDNWTGTSAANKWINILFSGNGQRPANDPTYPNKMNIQYGVVLGSGQQTSENLFIGCHFIWFDYGLTTQNPNALSNNIIGGNFSNCRLGAIWYHGGAGTVIGTGFQNALNGMQLVFGGYDIIVDQPANDVVTILNCRSESFNFANVAGSGGIKFVAKNCSAYFGLNRWRASTSHVVNDVIGGNNAVTPDGAVWMCTATSGSAPFLTGTVEPNWAANTTGTIVDGQITWTRQLNLMVTGGAGACYEDCLFAWGQVSVSAYYKRCNFSRPDVVQYTSTLLDTAAVGFEDCTVTPGGGPSDGGFIPWGLGNGSKHIFSSYRSASSALLWISNSLNQQFEAGFDYGDTTRNILGVYGALGKKTPIGTDISALDFLIYGGLSTGMGSPGGIRLRVGQPGASGNVVNDAVDALTVLPTGLSFGPAGSPIIRDFTNDYAYAPGTITNGSNVTQTNSLYGVLPGDIIDVATSVAVPAGVILQAQASAPDTVQLVTLNSSGSSQTPTSGRVRYNVRSRTALAGVTGHTPAQDVSQFQTDMGGASDFQCMYDGRINVITSSGLVTNWNDIAGSGGGKGPTLNVSGTGNPAYLTSQGLIIGNGTSVLSATSTAFDFSGTKTILFGVINVQASNSPGIVFLSNASSFFIVGNTGQNVVPSSLVVNDGPTGVSPASAAFPAVGAGNLVVRGGYALLSATSMTVAFFDQTPITKTITANVSGSSLLTLLSSNSPANFGIAWFAILNVALTSDQISTYRSWATAKHLAIPQ